MLLMYYRVERLPSCRLIGEVEIDMTRAALTHAEVVLCDTFPA